MSPYYADDAVTLYHGDALAVLAELPDESADCVVTSPPYYGLRDYGVPGQYGLEPSPAAYVETMRAVFAQVRRVLAKDGTCWLNLGDSYVAKPPGNVRGVSDRSTLNGIASERYRQTLERSVGTTQDKTKLGLPEKNLLGIPWRVAFALQDDGWVLRNAIVWAKPNAMPESVTDRLSTRHELVFLLVRSARYHFDLDAIREPLAYPQALTDGPHPIGGTAKSGTSRRAMGNAYGVTGMPEQTNMGPAGSKHTHRSTDGRNPGDVWSIPTAPFAAAHFAVMAPELARRAIIAGCKPGGIVLDPFCGSGTTGMVAGRHGRRFVGIDLSAAYLDLALRTRLAQGALIEDGAA